MINKIFKLKESGKELVLLVALSIFYMLGM